MADADIPAGAARKRQNLPLPRKLGPLEYLHEIQAVTSQPYLIRGLIAPGSAVLVFGGSNCGKTFFVIDLCLHIAGGQRWRDCRVNSGLVIYIAAEGGHGARNRLDAYRRSAPWTKGVPFALLPQAVDLLNPDADTTALIALVREAEETTGEKAAMIVIDTLARTMPGGDENSAPDMTAFIANVDRCRAETGAAMLIVHHCGKDTTRGARGHSSLRAAVDTEILIEGQEGVRTATVTKQRDLSSGQVYAFTLEPVTIGTDDEGELITSCVVATTDAPTIKKAPTGKQQLAILKMVEAQYKAGELVMTTGKIKQLARENLDMPKTSAQSAVLGLTNSGFLVATIGGLALTDPPGPTA